MSLSFRAIPGLDPGIHRATGTMDPRIKSAGDALLLAESGRRALGRTNRTTR
jgi:hypothetical protein